MRGSGALELKGRSPAQFAEYLAEPVHPAVAADVQQIDTDLNRLTLDTVSQPSVRALLESAGVDRVRDGVRMVLRAYVQRYRHPGYAQGLHLPAAVLLCFMDAESAFWCTCALVDRLFPRDFFARPPVAMHGLLIDSEVLARLVADALPALASSLGREHLGALMQMLAPKLLVPLFVDELPLPSLLAVWDAVWSAHGSVAALWATVGLLHVHSHALVTRVAHVRAEDASSAAYTTLLALLSGDGSERAAGQQAAALRSALDSASQWVPAQRVGAERARARAEACARWSAPAAAAQLSASVAGMRLESAELSALHGALLGALGARGGCTGDAAAALLPWLSSWAPLGASAQLCERARAVLGGPAPLDIRIALFLASVALRGSLPERVDLLLALFDAERTGFVAAERMHELGACFAEAQAARLRSASAHAEARPSARVWRHAYDPSIAAAGQARMITQRLLAADSTGRRRLGFVTLVRAAEADEGVRELLGAPSAPSAPPADLAPLLEQLRAFGRAAAIVAQPPPPPPPCAPPQACPPFCPPPVAPPASSPAVGCGRYPSLDETRGGGAQRRCDPSAGSTRTSCAAAASAPQHTAAWPPPPPPGDWQHTALAGAALARAHAVQSIADDLSRQPAQAGLPTAAQCTVQ